MRQPACISDLRKRNQSSNCESSYKAQAQAKVNYGAEVRGAVILEEGEVVSGRG